MSGTSTSSISGSTGKTGVQLKTTDPQYSNSGSMFAAIAYAALSHSETVGDLSPKDPWIPVIKKYYDQLGSLPQSTPDLMNDFMNGATGPNAMAMVYESDYINSLGYDSTVRNSDTTLLYPDTDIISDDTLVAWTPAGQQLMNLFTSQGTSEFALRSGYRTTTNADAFSDDIQKKYHISVLNDATWRISVHWINIPRMKYLDRLRQLVYS